MAQGHKHLSEKDYPLHIAFIWHMHQPVYKDPFTGEYRLPWVRLHGTKDYYDMVSILDGFPTLHQTFNIVPSLIDQLMEYTEGEVSDRFMNLTKKPASVLTVEDRRFILKRFFMANWENMIRPFPRYWELLKKRGFHYAEEDVEDVLRYFSDEDFLDLQVLFNLTWIDPTLREGDRFLKGLVEKGRGYTEDEKVELLKRQIGILKLVVPKYRESKEKGIIELTTSPYYHPILPLLCDTSCAREAMPWVTLPRKGFSHPEDALTQIKMGIDRHTKVFGERPKGMWPPEGGVSEAIIPLITREDIDWIATDEGILAQSLGRTIRRDDYWHCLDPYILYKVYYVNGYNNKKLSIIFRDHILSDLIGFVYSTWPAKKAADDFIERLHYIRNSLKERGEGHLVTIALDGENAWEYYKRDGGDFLNALYTRLAQNPAFKLVTVTEHLSEFPPQDELTRLYPGSWIDHNFRIWIGHPEDNTAWDHLAEARETLITSEDALRKSDKFQDIKDKIDEAWKGIYIAEGSDWFWWYGEEHTTLMDWEFDELFRNHLKRVYTLIGEEPPPTLDIPVISKEQAYKPHVVPTAFINPIIDGEITSYFEWLGAGRIEQVQGGMAMHREKRGGLLIEAISYGFNQDILFFRFDYAKGIDPSAKRWRLRINFIHPWIIKSVIDINGLGIDNARIWEKEPTTGEWIDRGELAPIKIKDVIEMAIPFTKLGVRQGEEIRFFIIMSSEDFGQERWPTRGYIALEVPSEDFERYNWWV